ncbi:DgyrCDS11500 [Dimorphilus gyrociliatus]|uniref:DgyrCDS11500 n=1 Tax=Dimorphilus gyrociliatus TaxID=2664684 RepID=A0A7I8W4U5_9ANNE|nr:DgyrCDS11500 [Dimorphilus gyrociliatus]
MFLVDESTTIEEEDFQKELDFVRSIIPNLAMESSKVRAGLELFATNSRLISGLSGDSKKLESSLSGLEQQFGNTRMVKALSMAMDELNRNARKNVSKILLFITDGLPTDNEYDMKNIIQRVKSHNIIIFSIAVGTEYNDVATLAELKSFASEPTDKHFFHVENYDSLKNLWPYISETCQTDCAVKGETDIIYSIPDYSGIDDSVALVNYLDREARKYESAIKRGEIRIGVDFQMMKENEGFNLKTYEREFDGMIKELKDFRFLGLSNTFIEDIVNDANVEFKNANRPGANRVVIIVVDLQRITAASLSRQVANLKTDTLNVVILGVGGGDDKSDNSARIELNKAKHIKYFSFDSYDEINIDLEKTLCEGL